MIHARARCWIHEDCVANPELGAACGPNVPDLPALDSDRWYKDVYIHRLPGGDGGMYEKGDGREGLQGDGHLLCAMDGDGQCIAIDIYRNSGGDGSDGGDVMGHQEP